MASDINRLFDGLNFARENILTIVDKLNTVAKDAVGFNGSISRTIPLNLKVTIDALIEIVQGKGQSSLEKLIEFLDSVPISEIRKQSLTKKALNDTGITQTQDQVANMANPVNIAPDTSSGPRSAITQEATEYNPKNILAEFLKENYKKPSYRQLAESHELSFDAIRNSDEFDLDTGTDPFEGVPISASSFADQYSSSLDPLDNGIYSEFDDEQPLYPSDYLNDGLPQEIFPQSEIINAEANDNWRNVLTSIHPEERDIGSIINDSREPV
jgi:hypothetical protein